MANTNETTHYAVLGLDGMSIDGIGSTAAAGGTRPDCNAPSIYCEICGDEIYTGARCDECQPEFCKCCGEEMGEDGCRSCASEDAKAHAADLANDIAANFNGGDL